MQVIISFRDEKAVSFDWREWVNGELRQDRQDLRRGERLVISLLSLLLFLSLFYNNKLQPRKGPTADLTKSFNNE